MAERPLPVSKLRIRRRKRRLAVALILFFILIFLAAALAGVTWLPQVRIKTIEIVGATSVNTKNAEEIVRQRIDERYGFVVRRDNLLLYPQKEVEEVLIRKFPVIGDIQIHAASINALRVIITERTVAALWCGESQSTPSPCYLLDKSGVAYAPAADFSGQVFVKYYGPISGGSMRQYVSTNEFRAVSAFVDALRTKVKDDAPVAASIENGSVRVTFASGFVLIYSSKDNGADVLERFVLALQAEPFIKHRLSDFEYLDLRFGDKLYYKLK